MEYGDRRWRLLVAQLSGTASGWAGGHRRPRPGYGEVIAELREITDRPDVLADAAAVYVVDTEARYSGHVVQVLLDAGTDPDLVGEYAEQRRERRAHGFDLGAFASALGERHRA